MPLPSTEITVKLTRKGIAGLLETQAQPEPGDHDGPERRRSPRGQCTGTVEIYPTDGKEHPPGSASVRNVSEIGLGMSADRYFEPGLAVAIVLHLAKASFHGRAVVRYCQQVRGEYMTGVEFIF